MHHNQHIFNKTKNHSETEANGMGYGSSFMTFMPGGTCSEWPPLYALDKYVQLQRVCFLSAFDLGKVIDIDHIVREIGLVFFFRSGLALS